MYFKAKDFVTAGNAVCGVSSVICIVEGHPYWAAFLICFAWLFDVLDGVVARLTNTFNKFGGEFDSMCDHLTYGIAPCFVVYGVYSEWLPDHPVLSKVIGGVLGCSLPLVASIRGAVFAVKPLKVSGFWIGLPRPVSAFAVVTYLNTSIFSLFPEWSYPLGIVLVFALAAMNLGAVPFMSHHGRVWPPYVSLLIVIGVTGIIGSGILGPIMAVFYEGLIPAETFFDVFFFIVSGYLLFQWFGCPKEDWDRAQAAVAEWRAQEMP